MVVNIEELQKKLLEATANGDFATVQDLLTKLPPESINYGEVFKLAALRATPFLEKYGNRNHSLIIESLLPLPQVQNWIREQNDPHLLQASQMGEKSPDKVIQRIKDKALLAAIESPEQGNINIPEINRLLREYEPSRNAAFLALKYVASRGLANILNILLNEPSIAKHATRQKMEVLYLAITSGSLETVERLFRIDNIRNAISINKARKFSFLKAACTGKQVPILNRLLEVPAFQALVNDNYNALLRESLEAGPEYLPIVDRLLQETAVQKTLNGEVRGIPLGISNELMQDSLKRAIENRQLAKIYRMIMAFKHTAACTPVTQGLFQFLIDPTFVECLRKENYADLKQFMHEFLPRLEQSFVRWENEEHKEEKEKSEIFFHYQTLRPLCLPHAAECGDLAKVRNLIHELTTTNPRNITQIRTLTLQAAARSGNGDLVTDLLTRSEFRDEVSSDNNEALSCAAMHNHLDIVNRLLKEGVRNLANPKALNIAAIHGHDKIVERLLQEKIFRDSLAEANNDTLPAAIHHNQLAIVQRLIQCPELQVLPSQWAAFYGSNAHPNVRNLLLKTVQSGNLQMLECLLSLKGMAEYIKINENENFLTALKNENLAVLYRLAVEYSKNSYPLPRKFFSRPNNELFKELGFKEVSGFFRDYVASLQQKLELLKTINTNLNDVLPAALVNMVIDYWGEDTSIKRDAAVLIPYEHHGAYIVLENVIPIFGNPWAMVTNQCFTWNGLDSFSEVDDFSDTNKFFGPTESTVMCSYSPILIEYRRYLAREITQSILQLSSIPRNRRYFVDGGFKDRYIIQQEIENSLKQVLVQSHIMGNAETCAFKLKECLSKILKRFQAEIEDIVEETMDAFQLKPRCHYAAWNAFLTTQKDLLDKMPEGDYKEQRLLLNSTRMKDLRDQLVKFEEDHGHSKLASPEAEVKQDAEARDIPSLSQLAVRDLLQQREDILAKLTVLKKRLLDPAKERTITVEELVNGLTLTKNQSATLLGGSLKDLQIELALLEPTILMIKEYQQLFTEFFMWKLKEKIPNSYTPEVIEKYKLVSKDLIIWIPKLFAQYFQNNKVPSIQELNNALFDFFKAIPDIEEWKISKEKIEAVIQALIDNYVRFYDTFEEDTFEDNNFDTWYKTIIEDSLNCQIEKCLDYDIQLVALIKQKDDTYHLMPYCFDSIAVPLEPDNHHAMPVPRTLTFSSSASSACQHTTSVAAAMSSASASASIAAHSASASAAAAMSSSTSAHA